jgi:DNA-binding CsgD family transcriptional regulator
LDAFIRSYFRDFFNALISWSRFQLDKDHGTSQESGCPQDASPLLRNPTHFLPILAEAIDMELAFFSHDLEGRITFLSQSAQHVFNHNPKDWIGRRFVDALTESPCNDHLKLGIRPIEHAPDANGQVCEIFDREGNRIKIWTWRTQIVEAGQPVGLAGVARRIEPPARTAIDFEVQELLERARSLSKVEREVIEMVIDGHMNKTIAGMLDVAVRTIESRRSRAMVKLKVKSLSELVKIWMTIRRAEGRTDM